MFTGVKLTEEGKTLNAYLVASKLPITFTKMEIGSGITETINREELVNSEMKTLIEKVSAIGSTNIFRATFTNEHLDVGFDVREVGIFALNETGEEILYAYDNAGSGEVDYFEAGTGNVILKEVFEIAATFSNAMDVQLKINPQYVFVTADELEQRLDDGYKYYSMQIDLNYSSPAVGRGITYSGGCENFGEDEWMKFFGIKPCILNGHGEVNSYLNPNDYTKDLNGTDVSELISTVDTENVYNVMVEYPRRGYRINYDEGTKVALLEITDNPAAGGYCYNAFKLGKHVYNRMFIGAYNCYIDNSMAFSLSGKELSVLNSSENWRTYAENLGDGFSIVDLQKIAYIQLLYTLLNKTINGKVCEGFSVYEKTTGRYNLSGMNIKNIKGNFNKHLGIESYGGWEFIDYSKYEDGFIVSTSDANGDSTKWSRQVKVGEGIGGYMGTNIFWDENVGVINRNNGASAGQFFNISTPSRVTGSECIIGGSNVYETTFKWQLSSFFASSRICYM